MGKIRDWTTSWRSGIATTACTSPSSIAPAYGGTATQVSSFRLLHGAHYPLDSVSWRQSTADRMKYVLPAIVAVVVGPLSAWITVQLSLRRFRTEKLWEMRAEAYKGRDHGAP